MEIPEITQEWLDDVEKCLNRGGCRFSDAEKMFKIIKGLLSNLDVIVNKKEKI